MSRGFASLTEAIEWVQPRWQERPVPYALHESNRTLVLRPERGNPSERHTKGQVWRPDRRSQHMSAHGHSASWTTEGELGGPRYSQAFMTALSAGCDDKETVELTESCYHPLMAIGQDIRECEGCYGTGAKKAYRERFRFPMWRAFSKLVHARNDTPRHPHPAERVLALAAVDWDGPVAAVRLERHWDVAEPLFLTALRQLAGRYEEAPVGRVGRKSEAQSMAEAVA